LVRLLVRCFVGLLVSPHITSKTDYVAIALRRGEGRGNQLMSKTGYVEIASRLVTVAHSCFMTNPRARFRHEREGQLPRAPTKRGAPTNEEPRAKADSNKGSSSQKGFNALGVGPLELWLP
jgi:hypothetical protein